MKLKTTANVGQPEAKCVIKNLPKDASSPHLESKNADYNIMKTNPDSSNLKFTKARTINMKMLSNFALFTNNSSLWLTDYFFPYQLPPSSRPLLNQSSVSMNWTHLKQKLTHLLHFHVCLTKRKNFDSWNSRLYIPGIKKWLALYLCFAGCVKHTEKGQYSLIFFQHNVLSKHFAIQRFLFVYND